MSIQNIRNLITGDKNDLRSLIIRGIGGTFALRLFFVGINFVIRFVLARVLGADGLGVYSYALAWLDVLMVVTVLGFNQLLTREAVVFRTQSDWGGMRGLLHFTNRAILVTSAVCAAVVVVISLISLHQQAETLRTAFIALPLNIPIDPVPVYALWLMLLILPAAVLTDLRQAAMRAFDQVIRSMIPELFLRPALILVLMVGVSWLVGGGFNAAWAMGLNALATGTAFMFGAHLLQRALPPDVHTAQPQIYARTWITSALPLAVIAGMTMLNLRIDQTMLGTIIGAEAVGVYSLAALLAQMTYMVHLGTIHTLSPNIVRLHTSGEMKRLENIVRKTVTSVTLVSALMGGAIILLREPLLRLFGAEFLRGEHVLIILVLSALFNIATGPVSMMLMMTRHERDATISICISLLGNVLLNLVLIPRYGIEGAALAAAVSLTLVNVIQVAMIRRRLGINPTIFHWPKG